MLRKYPGLVIEMSARDKGQGVHLSEDERRGETEIERKRERKSVLTHQRNLASVRQLAAALWQWEWLVSVVGHAPGAVRIEAATGSFLVPCKVIKHCPLLTAVLSVVMWDRNVWASRVCTHKAYTECFYHTATAYYSVAKLFLLTGMGFSVLQCVRYLFSDHMLLCSISSFI